LEGVYNATPPRSYRPLNYNPESDHPITSGERLKDYEDQGYYPPYAVNDIVFLQRSLNDKTKLPYVHLGIEKHISYDHATGTRTESHRATFVPYGDHNGPRTITFEVPPNSGFQIDRSRPPPPLFWVWLRSMYYRCG
jgi:hypothetical protein